MAEILVNWQNWLLNILKNYIYYIQDCSNLLYLCIPILKMSHYGVL